MESSAARGLGACVQRGEANEIEMPPTQAGCCTGCWHTLTLLLHHPSSITSAASSLRRCAARPFTQQPHGRETGKSWSRGATGARVWPVQPRSGMGRREWKMGAGVCQRDRSAQAG